MKNVYHVTQNPSVPDPDPQRWQKKKEFSCLDSLSKEAIQTAAAYSKRFCSTWGATVCTRSPTFLGPAILGGPALQHSSFQESDNELQWGSNGEPGFAMINNAYERSCWRSLRFLGSLSFVYFSRSTFLFCPLGYSARSFPISCLIFEPHMNS